MSASTRRRLLSKPPVVAPCLSAPWRLMAADGSRNRLWKWELRSLPMTLDFRSRLSLSARNEQVDIECFVTHNSWTPADKPRGDCEPRSRRKAAWPSSPSWTKTVTGQPVTDRQMASLSLKRDNFHGDTESRQNKQFILARFLRLVPFFANARRSRSVFYEPCALGGKNRRGLQRLAFIDSRLIRERGGAPRVESAA